MVLRFSADEAWVKQGVRKRRERGEREEELNHEEKGERVGWFR